MRDNAWALGGNREEADGSVNFFDFLSDQVQQLMADFTSTFIEHNVSKFVVFRRRIAKEPLIQPTVAESRLNVATLERYINSELLRQSNDQILQKIISEGVPADCHFLIGELWPNSLTVSERNHLYNSGFRIAVFSPPVSPDHVIIGGVRMRHHFGPAYTAYAAAVLICDGLLAVRPAEKAASRYFGIVCRLPIELQMYVATGLPVLINAHQFSIGCRLLLVQNHS